MCFILSIESINSILSADEDGWLGILLLNKIASEIDIFCVSSRDSKGKSYRFLKEFQLTDLIFVVANNFLRLHLYYAFLLFR